MLSLRSKTVVLVLALMPVLAGCAMDTPTALTQRRVEVVEETYRAEINTKEIDSAVIEQIAHDYAYAGGGPVDVLVTYDPKSKSNTAMTATENATRIARALKKNGVREVRIDTLPVHDTETSRTLLSYMSYRAQEPAGCVNLMDIDDTDPGNFSEYELGCTSESFLARQIYRPHDLLGRDGAHEELGARKHANNTEGYKWGANLVGDTEAEETSE